MGSQISRPSADDSASEAGTQPLETAKSSPVAPQVSNNGLPPLSTNRHSNRVSYSIQQESGGPSPSLRSLRPIVANLPGLQQALRERGFNLENDAFDTRDVLDVLSQLCFDSEKEAIDPDHRLQFLLGIDSIKCSICNHIYGLGDHKEKPVMLPCNHAFGSKCLAHWLDSVSIENSTCPRCKRYTYKPNDSHKHIDTHIEAAVFGRPTPDPDVDPVDHAMLRLIDFKWDALNRESTEAKHKDVFRFPMDSAWAKKDCIHACIQLYLEQSIKRAIKEDRGTGVYQRCLDSVKKLKLRHAMQAQEELESILIDKIKASFPHESQLLAERLIERRVTCDQSPKEIGRELYRAAQKTPILLACLAWCRKTGLLCPGWDLDLRFIDTCEHLENKKIGYTQVVGCTYTTKDMLNMLKNKWSVIGADEWDAFKIEAKKKEILTMRVQPYYDSDSVRRVKVDWAEWLEEDLDVGIKSNVEGVQGEWCNSEQE